MLRATLNVLNVGLAVNGERLCVWAEEGEGHGSAHLSTRDCSLPDEQYTT